MAKKKKDEKNNNAIPIDIIDAIQHDYINDVETSVEFSLTVDPEDKYHMDALQKKFIEYYCQFKNVNTAADLAGIDMNLAKSYFVAYSTQNEIRRINRAFYHRQFAQKLMTIDEIGGYLSALLMDEVPYADRIKPYEKLKVASMIVELNKLKAESMNNPDELMFRDVESQLKNLSVETIQQLLYSAKETKKDEIVNNINNDLLAEEKEFLKSLSTEQLLQILNATEQSDSDNSSNESKK